MPSSHLFIWRSLFLHSIFPSVKDFSNESAVGIRWPKYWSFSFSISSSNKYSGLISLKTDWFELPAVQGTFRSLPQQHSSRAYYLALCFLYSPALIIICDHWEDHSLDYRDLCWQSTICFSIYWLGLSSFSCQEATVFWFHGCSHHMQWFSSPRERICHYFHLFPFYLPWSNGAECHDLSFF